MLALCYARRFSIFNVINVRKRGTSAFFCCFVNFIFRRVENFAEDSFVMDNGDAIIVWEVLFCV